MRSLLLEACTVREEPCSVCKGTGQRKDRECAGCDGGGFTYEALVLSRMTIEEGLDEWPLDE